MCAGTCITYIWTPFATRPATSQCGGSHRSGHWLLTLADSVDGAKLGEVSCSPRAGRSSLSRDFQRSPALAEALRLETEGLVGGFHALRPRWRSCPTVLSGVFPSASSHFDLDAPLPRPFKRKPGGLERPVRCATPSRADPLSLCRRDRALDYLHREPEAHLHPHLQRRMFGALRMHDGAKQTTIVTTHSPHIVSVTSPKDLVVLRQRAEVLMLSVRAAHPTLNNMGMISLGISTRPDPSSYLPNECFSSRYAEQVLIPSPCGVQDR